jgi:hypothetical protein
MADITISKIQDHTIRKASPNGYGMDLSMESMAGFIRPTEINNHNISRITQPRDFSAFCDVNDSKIMEML